MGCPKCNGIMYHRQTFRKESVPNWVEVRNWYRPTLEQTLKMSEGAISHVLSGGLFLEDEIM